jgi:hypothetical protein
MAKLHIFSPTSWVAQKKVLYSKMKGQMDLNATHKFVCKNISQFGVSFKTAEPFILRFFLKKT